MYVTVDIAERDVLDKLSQRTSAESAEIDKNARDLKLRLKKADGTIYEHPGQFHSIDNQVDSGTGTIEVTAIFPNPDGAMAAGLSVRLGIPVQNEPAVMIPAAAIQRDLLGTYVFVIGEGAVAERRGVEVSRFDQGDLALIDSGLTAEDRVVVSNLQRVREGLEVNPTELEPPSLDTGGAPEEQSGNGEGDA